MNGSERIAAETGPPLLARLQATMPAANGQSSSAPASSQPAPVNGGFSSSRLRPNTIASSSSEPTALPSAILSSPAGLPLPLGEAYPSMRAPEPKPRQSGFQRARKAIAAHRWLIVMLLAAGGILGFYYTTQICVPLYRIDASIELQSSGALSSAEVIVHVLESQSLIKVALATMPEAESNQLIENPRLNLFFSSPEVVERLRDRLQAIASPLGQVIDLSLISPNRQAGADFLNALIRSLIQRNQEQKLLASTLPAEEMTSQQGHSDENISVIDPASASTEPVAPSMPLNVSVGALCGMVAGIAFALIRLLATTTFAGPGSVGQVLGVRELGAIPERKLLAAPGSDAANSAMQMDANDESLRYLRSSLLYHPGKQEVRYLAFTSAAPGEGKTTVVTNLSMSLAATGRRVLVIDGDLRRPRLYRVLQVPQGPGLSDLLRRSPAGPPAILSKFVSPTSFQNLYVLPPGTAGDDVPELLAGPLLSKLIRDLGKSFDFVLIDTPPLLACSDARNYARAVEGVVLVVRSSETQKSAALVARDMLLQDGATIVGTVLTGWRQAYPAYNYPSTANYSRP